MIPSRISDSRTYHVEDIAPAAPSQGAKSDPIKEALREFLWEERFTSARSSFSSPEAVDAGRDRNGGTPKSGT